LLDYHEFTKHTVEKLRRMAHVLDWANMPDPYRHYEGVPVVDLPARATLGAALQDGAAFLSCLLFHSAAISASKKAPRGDYRYSLRVNPSSGNLHPTEFHFTTRGLANWPDGVYHYRPSSHMAEQRGTGGDGPPSLEFTLTSIAWREAWKYRDRAWRYCLLDMGHACESLMLAARWMGCRATVTHASPMWPVADDEWPMLSLRIEGAPLAEAPGRSLDWLGGTPNRLSDEIAPYPRIDHIHAATEGELYPRPVDPAAGQGSLVLPPPAPFLLAYPEACRARRSALDFVGGSISAAQLAALLDFAAPLGVNLWLYVHGVDDVEPGAYRWWPASRSLHLRRSGPQRVVASGLSLGQDLAGNSCVTFSITADLRPGYRAAFINAGRVGQRLYIAAESLGLRATGIGAFFDDQVHRYLDIDTETEQVVYHFAIGHPMRDNRLDAE